MEREVRVETGFLDDADTVIVAFGTPAEFVRSRDPAAARRRSPDRLRPARSRLWPFPYRDGRRGRRRGHVAASAVFELSAGQMIDDVRIGACWAGAGGRASAGLHRRFGFRRRAASSTSTWSGERILALHGGGPDAELPATARQRAQPSGKRAGHGHDRHRASPRAARPAAVECAHPGPAAHRRSTIMCPGCGEPLALRQPPRDDHPARPRPTHTIGVAGIGCYTSFSSTIDVDLVQALHGRAPSVATGVKRMLPDATRVHLAGRRRHGQRGPAGGHPHRGAWRDSHVHPAQQRRVRRDRRPHDRHDRARSAHQEHHRRPRRRLPRLPDPDRRPARPASTARRTSPAARCTTPARWPARKKMFERAFESQQRRRGVLVRRDAHHVPDRLVHPDRRGPRLHDTRRWARSTSWAS